MNTIDPAVLSKSQQQILHVDPAVLSDFQRQIFQLERDNTSELIHFEQGGYADSTFCPTYRKFS